ncbi:CYTH and CHAD domain-containing protein [Clavibacter sp. VKM Ac-2872]|uniref:CYTH and CHAD domain-containing protein n=1 Tax=Clavibacter sp. VKM Ac-2872 TaxID=2783812 RepID=UPI00188CA0D6|nr:CYTH and CHAD domain-containing protein [Clavibacter sp. VKM Ac-2872]MBF4625231.1 CYTH and CHAD domain-containing protein [Clavibacter sp. VKM Ac-2872]
MVHTSSVEIERKYDVPEGILVPDLAGIEGIAEARTAEPVTLVAVYLDTADHALADRRMILRRREGGHDAGWHVKLPADGGEGRTELGWPLRDGDDDDGAIPDAVLDQVAVHVRGRELTPLARLETVRTTVTLHDADGRAVAEFADDRVTGSDVRGGTVRAWHEWEVELLPDAPAKRKQRTALLDRIERHLVDAGAQPSDSASKLARALGADALGRQAPAGPALPDPATLTKESPASDVARAVLARGVRDLVAADPHVRADEHDAVHRMRVAVRRLRSALRTHQDVIDPAATAPVRAELTALGTVLGGARDLEVLRDRVVWSVVEHDTETVPDHVGDALHDVLDERYRRARERVIRALSSARYHALLDDLDRLVADPPLTHDASAPAGPALHAALRRDAERVGRRAAVAQEAVGEAARTEALHEVRKAAKRLRYAAEEVSGRTVQVLGRKTMRLATAAEEVHDELGEHRDGLAMQRVLRDEARRLAARGEDAFALGVLHEAERLRTESALWRAERAIERLLATAVPGA